jgi:hypothetical protein
VTLAIETSPSTALRQAIFHAGRASAAYDASGLGGPIDALRRRREALYATEAEGFAPVTMTELCRILSEDSATHVEKNARFARAAHGALTREHTLRRSNLGPVELFDLADDLAAGLLGGGRSLRPDPTDPSSSRAETAADLQSIVQAMAETMAEAERTAEPEHAAEFLRWIVRRPELNQADRHARRLVRLLSLRLSERAIGFPAGVSRGMALDRAALKEAAEDRDLFHAVLFAHWRADLEASVRQIGDVERLRRNLLADVNRRYRRRSPLIEPTVDYLLSHPVSSIGNAARTLDITGRGAGLIFLRLKSAGILEQRDDKQKNRTFVCPRAAEAV